MQYLAPFKRAFEEAGCEVVLTARDVGMTFELLHARQLAFHAVGAEARGAKARKVLSVLERAYGLARAFARGQRPVLVVTASRSATLAARYLGIPAFVFCDYEYVDLKAARVARAYVLFPDVIDADVMRRRGIKRERMVGFRGLKEDITFADVDVEAIEPHVFGTSESTTTVLFRPPAEHAHYYVKESKGLALALLARLSGRSDVTVVYSPRHSSQRAYLDTFTWRNAPIVLDEPVYFVSLLKAVDAVVSSGGTMLREAAYLGVPAYSIFQSRIGAVDRHLESIGRLAVVSRPEDLDDVRRTSRSLDPLQTTRDLPAELARTMLEAIAR